METGRRPTGRAPLPAATSSPDAVIRVFAARTVRWRSIFAVHTWIVVKKKGATSYTRYDYTAWGEPIRTNGFAPDGRWFGAVPETVVAVDGVRAELRSCFPAWEQLTTVVTRPRWRFDMITSRCFQLNRHVNGGHHLSYYHERVDPTQARHSANLHDAVRFSPPSTLRTPPNRPRKCAEMARPSGLSLGSPSSACLPLHVFT